MKLRGVFVVLLGLQICQPAVAGSLFRCEVNGRVEFSDRRCQPARPSCAERDGKEALHGQCAKSASDTGRPPVSAAAAQARGNGGDGPARLALNETASSTESRSRSR